ncbi:MAG: peptidase M14 [Hyphomicrobiales bacterium]
MSVIFERCFPPILDGLIERFARPAYRHHRIEAWLFVDEPTRREGERKFADYGIAARLRSAYKPLLHAVLEDISPTDIARLDIAYPRHEIGHENRFRLETYPLAGLCGPAQISFSPGRTDSLVYDVSITRTDGACLRHEIFAPNREHRAIDGTALLSPTGWLKVSDADGGVIEDRRLETEYEALFQATVAAIADHDWGDGEPWFEELNIRVSLPVHDRELPVGDEFVSLREALHEEFYFTLLKMFHKKSGRPASDRTVRPGQIAPEILYGGPVAKVTVETRCFAAHNGATVAPHQPLDRAERAIGIEQVDSELAKIGGQVFSARSYAGRKIDGRYHEGHEKPVMISAGQHANETSGVVGALRAAHALIRRPGAHFAISPLENPDGYALHQRLILDNPRYMHHSARYTALGDDLEYRRPPALWEKAIRIEAQRLTGAKLHINLHGYPAHEWTQPLSGYIPHGFALWMLPKGFFPILRHHEGWRDHAERLIDVVTARLAGVPGLKAFNDRQIALYDAHAGGHEFRIVNGFACLVSQNNDCAVPLTLITEYPDETVYGDAFVAAHTAQMATVIAAYEAWQALSIAANR